jgi:DHA2 family multidrug resistance protein-like MFS transporter
MSAAAEPAPTATAPMSPGRQWAALAVLLLAVLIISIDNTVLGFAVPAVSASLAPSSTELLWIVDAYAFVLAGLLVTMGNLGDRIGRRRLLLLGAVGFGVASTMAAFSTSPAMLIAARALLGVAGATLMPSTLSLIRNIFVDPARRRMAIAVWASGFAVGSALGPIVGGWLLEHYWWGSVFLLALPVMVVLVVAGRLLLPESRGEDLGPFDWLSSPLSLAAIVPVVYAVKVTAEHGPSLSLLGLAAFGAAMGVVFIRRQQRLVEPMLDVSMFSHRPFTVAICTNLASNFALIGGVFFLAQYFQLVAGLSPLSAGYRLLPGMVASLGASLGVVVLLRRGVAPARLLGVSMATAAIGYLTVTTLGGDGGSAGATVAMGFVGLGVGAASSLGTNLVIATVPARRAGSASAVSETAFELGAALGVALLGSTINAFYRRTVELPAGLDPAVAGPASDTITAAAAVASDLPTGLADSVRTAAQDAFVNGLHGAGVVGAVLLLTAAVAAARTLRGITADDLDGEH